MEEKKEKTSFWSNRKVQNGICIVSFVSIVMCLAAAWMVLKTVENDYYLNRGVFEIASLALRTPKYADFPNVQLNYPLDFSGAYRLLRYGGGVFFCCYRNLYFVVCGIPDPQVCVRDSSERYAEKA